MGHIAPATLAAVSHWVVMDRTFRVTEACVALTELVGRSVFSANPAGEPVMRPLYETAWRCGHAADRVLLRGKVWDVAVERRGEFLHVQGEYVDELDTATLETLEASLHRVASAFAAREPDQRPVLRVV